MSRYPAAFAAVSVVALAALALPAQAAPTASGSYDVTLLPDPTGYTADAPVDDTYARCGAVQGHVLFWEFSEHGRVFRPSTAGTLTVTLEMKDPTGTARPPAGLDWDLRIYDAARGRLLTASTGLGASERTVTQLAAQQPVVIVACNDSGLPQAHVAYVFRQA
jgi:hypothetical protein